jgi:predicted DsbA family dithiol-disulfide isomerase
MTATPTKLTVEIWMDVICPFCWIGLTRFHKALAGFGHADEVDVIHQAYRLLRDVKPQAGERLLVQKLGSIEEVNAQLQKVEQMAASEGLSYRLTGTYVGDSCDAHRLIKLAAQRGLAEATMARLFRGYYSEHASVFDRDSLTNLATDAGLERSDVEDLLLGDRYRAEVEADEQRFKALGGRSTPFFVIDGEALPPGQDTQSLTDALAKAWTTRQAPARASIQ